MVEWKLVNQANPAMSSPVLALNRRRNLTIRDSLILSIGFLQAADEKFSADLGSEQNVGHLRPFPLLVGPTELKLGIRHQLG
jgi:hypothetical protein